MNGNPFFIPQIGDSRAINPQSLATFHPALESIDVFLVNAKHSAKHFLQIGQIFLFARPVQDLWIVTGCEGKTDHRDEYYSNKITE